MEKKFVYRVEDRYGWVIGHTSTLGKVRDLLVRHLYSESKLYQSASYSIVVSDKDILENRYSDESITSLIYELSDGNIERYIATEVDVLKEVIILTAKRKYMPEYTTDPDKVTNELFLTIKYEII